MIYSLQARTPNLDPNLYCSELPSASVGSLLLIGRHIFSDDAAVDNVGLAAGSNVVVATADEPVADGKQKHKSQNNNGVIHLPT